MLDEVEARGIMNIVIAGCGYLGRALGLSLSQAGHRVWGICRSSNLPAEIMPIQADVGEITVDALPNTDILLYMLSPDVRDEMHYRSTYVENLQHLLGVYRQHSYRPKRFLYVSSTGVYEQRQGEWVDEKTPLAPVNPLNQILIEAETLVQSVDWMQSTVVRFSGIYGPNRHPLLDALYRGDARICTSKHYSNRIHLVDCVGVLMHLMRVITPAPLYVATDNEPTPINTIISWLSSKTGQPLPEGKISGSAEEFERRSNKRCNNALLLHSGYQMNYQNYHQGFLQILQEKGLVAIDR